MDFSAKSPQHRLSYLLSLIDSRAYQISAAFLFWALQRSDEVLDYFGLCAEPRLLLSLESAKSG
jgi:hypothetical protein